MQIQYSSNFLKALIIAAAAPKEGSLNAKFTFKGASPTNHFCMDRLANECLTISSLTVFTQRNFVAEFFFKRSVILHGKRLLFAFLSRGEGLGATYDVHLTLIEKRVVDFLLVLIEVFFC